MSTNKLTTTSTLYHNKKIYCRKSKYFKLTISNALKCTDDWKIITF